MSPASPRFKAILQAVLVTVLWPTSWLLIKIGLRNNLPAITFAGVESSILIRLRMPQIAILAFIFLGQGLTAKAISGLVLVGIGTIVV